MKSTQKKISVYILSKNYGKYAIEAIKSVQKQTFKNWELFLVNDNSDDNTHKIYSKYKNNKNIRIVNFKKNLGLQKISNYILKLCTGKYIFRLDADDWLNEYALELMYNKAEQNNNIAVVYSGYYYTNSLGKVVGVENNFDIVKGNNLPPHGACCLISVDFLKSVKGYSTKFKAQDGWDIWFKLKNKAKYECLPLPLFYYRKHNFSLSNNQIKILNERSKIIKMNKKNIKKNLNILAIIPVKMNYKNNKKVPFIKYKSKYLIDYAIEMVKQSKLINCSIISSSENQLLNYVKKKIKKNNIFKLHKRPSKLDASISKIEDVMFDSCKKYFKDYKKYPDIVVFINIHTIIKDVRYLDKLLDALLANKKLSTFSVIKQSDPLFMLKKKKFYCLNKGRFDNLEFNEELAFRFDNSVFAFWFEALISKRIFDGEVGFKENNKENIINIL